MNINETLLTAGVYLAPFADDICMYAMDHKEGYVLRRLQHILNSIETWCKCWKVKINEDKTWLSTSLTDLDHLRFISH
jgi:hypothetical protein